MQRSTWIFFEQLATMVDLIVTELRVIMEEGWNYFIHICKTKSNSYKLILKSLRVLLVWATLNL